MVINLHTSPNVKVNYDTLNEVYIVTEVDGTTNCSSAEVLLHQYETNSAVVGTINHHQNQVELFKDVVL